MKVTLREKKLTKGRKSLYLDIYPPIPNPETGKPIRTFYLELYIYEKPKGEIEKNHNKETLLLARKVAAERELDIQAKRFNFIRTKETEVDFVKYFWELTKKREKNNVNYAAWKSVYNYIKKFTNGSYPMHTINRKFCEDFKTFLLNTTTFRSTKTRLSQNAAANYFNKFKASIFQAFRDGLIYEDVASEVDFIKYEETVREFLTIEELRILSNTECEVPVLKTIALFSALTGLRFSDIQNLKWKNVQHSEKEGYFITFVQVKTKGVEKQYISDQAFNLLGIRSDKDESVFPNLKYSAWYNTKIQNWVTKAGINKKITFHCFRHTYATILLTEGTDIYTVSKMLGHRNLKTTQIYAKVVDQKKIEAANKIKLLNI